MLLGDAARRSRSTSRTRRTCCTASRRPAATSGRARCGARATSAPTCARRSRSTLVASTEPWDTVAALSPEDAAGAEAERAAPAAARSPASRARTALAAELVLAADQFIITPGRPRRGRGARARGGRRGPHRHRRLPLVHRLGPRHDDQPRRADAGDRPAREAGYILRTFAHYIRDGLIPNLFPEGENEGLYHTADATLWFFHALDRYLARDRRPRDAARSCCRCSLDIVEHHLARHALRHRRRSGRRPAARRGRRATSSPGWTPRSATGW